MFAKNRSPPPFISTLSPVHEFGVFDFKFRIFFKSWLFFSPKIGPTKVVLFHKKNLRNFPPKIGPKKLLSSCLTFLSKSG